MATARMAKGLSRKAGVLRGGGVILFGGGVPLYANADGAGGEGGPQNGTATTPDGGPPEAVARRPVLREGSARTT